MRKPLREICVGHEWSFGKGRAGNLALLKKLGASSTSTWSELSR